MTSAWSHGWVVRGSGSETNGWACDVVYLLRTYAYGPRTRGLYVRSAMSACLLCQSVPNSKNSVAVYQKQTEKSGGILTSQTRSVATRKCPFHYRSIQSQLQIAALVSVSD